MKNKKRLVGMLLVCTLVVLCFAGCQQGGAKKEEASNPTKTVKEDYPTKAVELVVPNNAGGGTDATARILAKNIKEYLGQNMVIVNMEGGAGTLACDHVSSSEPDGYRALYFHANVIINSIMGTSDKKWDEEFKYAGIIGKSYDYAMIVGSDAPYNNIEELKKYTEESGKKAVYAIETAGIDHLLSLGFQDKSGIECKLVDLGGAAKKITAMLGKQIDIMTMPYGNVKDYIQNGQFKILGIMGSERSPFIPDVKTFKEQGVDITHETFFFVAFPKETPDEIVNKMSQTLEKVTADENFKADMLKILYVSDYMNTEETLKYMKEKEEGYKKYAEMALKAKK